ncbi:TPA: hypothetical protein ACIYRQ_005636, partial [Escherichia coli]
GLMAEVNGALAAAVPATPLSPCRRYSCRHSEGQRRFAPARSVVAAGSCSYPPWCRITHLSPFAGAETSTTRLAVQGRLCLSQ